MSVGSAVEEQRERRERRLAAWVLLAGAALAVVGNGLHPIIPPDVGTQAFLEAVAATDFWVAIHLVVAASVALLVAGIVLVARWLGGTAGGPLGWLAATLALIGGVIFMVAAGGIDGVVMASLADQMAVTEHPELVLATAEAFLALDFALLGLGVALLLGGAYLALGLALQRADVTAAWIRWTAVIVGGAGIVVGVLQFLGVAEAVALYAFRAVALLATVIAIAIGVQLLRGTAVLPHDRPTQRA